jgi:multidrug efflux pump subunit AcrA (membrane-fusion protein)
VIIVGGSWLAVQHHQPPVMIAGAGRPFAIDAQGSPVKVAPNVAAPPSVQLRDGTQEIVVGLTTFIQSLSVVGTIVPGQSVAVLAPFDGVVKQDNFNYGQSVRRDDVLITLDKSDIEHQKRAAEIAYIKASQAEKILENWTSSPDVLRAARSKESADLALKVTEKKISETKVLLDKGLIARSEYDDILQQKSDRMLEVATAESDYNAALAKGGETEKSMARLALADAQAAMTQKLRLTNGATVSAPADGIISRPPSGKGDGGSSDVFAGVRLSAGQLIGVIARGDRLGVLFHLSEEDANRVREGQEVSVTGRGFPDLRISGHIVRVAAESSPSAQQMSSFEGMAMLDDLSVSDRNRVRFGMSADVKILLRDTGGAIVIPPQAIIGAGPEAEVDVKQAATNEVRRVKVGVGDVTPTGVEIRSGLRPGDIVIWRASP